MGIIQKHTFAQSCLKQKKGNHPSKRGALKNLSLSGYLRRFWSCIQLSTNLNQTSVVAHWTCFLISDQLGLSVRRSVCLSVPFSQTHTHTPTQEHRLQMHYFLFLTYLSNLVCAMKYVFWHFYAHLQNEKFNKLYHFITHNFSVIAIKRCS